MEVFPGYAVETSDRSTKSLSVIGKGRPSDTGPTAVGILPFLLTFQLGNGWLVIVSVQDFNCLFVSHTSVLWLDYIE